MPSPLSVWLRRPRWIKHWITRMPTASVICSFDFFPPRQTLCCRCYTAMQRAVPSRSCSPASPPGPFCVTLPSGIAVLEDRSGHAYCQRRAGSVSDAWQLMNHCESGANRLPSHLKWAESFSYRPTPSFPILKKNQNQPLFVLSHLAEANGVSFPINCKYICCARCHLIYALLIKHRLWFNKSIQQSCSKPLWAKSFLMLNVSLSNLSYFSISSLKTLIIKNEEGNDHKERLKNFNRIFEIIIALHYREQCLLIN